MGFNCGIVGLPNVGKSTLFNALTATAAAQAANFPFCTIEPNIGRVAVPDPRLDKISAITKSQTTVPTQLEFVDIAGLVRGASKGEGLGNQFLGNIRQVDAVLHVVRCFENDDITHVENSVDPIRDIDIIETELILSDMESVEKRAKAAEKKAKGNDILAKAELDLCQRLQPILDQGRPARALDMDDKEKALIKSFHLLTSKPQLYVCNVNEEDAATGNALTEKVAARAKTEGAQTVIISAAIEQEIAQLPPEEQKEFLDSLGLEEPGLNRVIRAGYELVSLITYFTTGPKETRAWTVRKNAKAPEAAGVIHNDFERGFIRAETIAYNDFIALGGEQACKEAGKMRSEGKEYVVQDGDILLFRFNV
ncbi:MAG: GTP-binding protein YchF [Alphaproteobacteria bacterium]|nr:GTP-binding protein YchF [Alphaproteobacteria bacterium]